MQAQGQHASLSSMLVRMGFFWNFNIQGLALRCEQIIVFLKIMRIFFTVIKNMQGPRPTGNLSGAHVMPSNQSYHWFR